MFCLREMHTLIYIVPMEKMKFHTVSRSKKKQKKKKRVMSLRCEQTARHPCIGPADENFQMRVREEKKQR